MTRRPNRPRSRVAPPAAAPATPVEVAATAAPTAAPGAVRTRPALGGRRAVVGAVLLLTLHGALAASSLVRENPTVDEVVHLPAGLTYWQTLQFKQYHHNPPLVKMVAAIPVLLAGAETRPIYDLPAWKAEFAPPLPFAQAFMALNAARYFELFARARLMVVSFSILGGLVVFAWSRRLYGDGGGLLSLTLWCLCPNVLAHARLVTSDVGATTLGAAATFAFWLYLRGPTWRRAALAGVVLGLAQLSKFSLLILYALWPILWLARYAADVRLPRPARRLAVAAGQGAWIVGLSVLTIDAGYAFEGVGQPLGRFDFASESLTRPGVTLRRPSRNQLLDACWAHRVNRFRGTILDGVPAPLPRHYLLGFDEQKIESEGVPAGYLDPAAPDPSARSGYPVYLDGVLRRHGWRDYYLRCLLYKVPEGTWLILGLSVAALLGSRRARAPWADEFPLLLIPAAVLGAMTFLTDINLGLRYVLPMLPYLYVSAGKVVPWAAGLGGFRRWLAIGLAGAGVLGATAATWSIHPHYLAYFNALSGGPDRDPPRLIDSNLDWGQDLVGLRRWLRDHPPDGPVGIAYFGQITPNLFADRGEGIDWFLPYIPPGRFRAMFRDPRMTASLRGPARSLTPGLYAVSASIVAGLPYRLDDPSRDVLPAAWQVDAGALSYFRRLAPFGRIGHSILLYRVTDADVARLGL